MKYFFNHKRQVEIEELYRLRENRAFYTLELVKRIPIYEYTDELEANWLIYEGDELTVWPVYAVGGFSWEFGEFKNKEEAYKELLDILNTGLYEMYHDL